jgi:hypothetical protein
MQMMPSERSSADLVGRFVVKEKKIPCADWSDRFVMREKWCRKIEIRQTSMLNTVIQMLSCS